MTTTLVLLSVVVMLQPLQLLALVLLIRETRQHRTASERANDD